MKTIKHTFAENGNRRVVGTISDSNFAASGIFACVEADGRSESYCHADFKHDGTRRTITKARHDAIQWCNDQGAIACNLVGFVKWTPIKVKGARK